MVGTTNTYRAGIVCQIGVHSYHHTGLTFHLRREDGSEFDLRTMQGFDRVEQKFDQYNSVTYGPLWSDLATADSAVASALKLIRVHQERFWWEAVSAFLVECHSKSALWQRAENILLNNGLNRQELSSLHS